MPKAERILLQVRLSASDKRRFKALAIKHGLTLQKAVVEAFAAWAEKLRTQAHDQRPASVAPPATFSPVTSVRSSASHSREWVKHALQLDWTKCPEVELREDGVHRVRVLRETDAPLSQVLRAVADGHPVASVAEIFDLELSHLLEVIDFVEATQSADALN